MKVAVIVSDIGPSAGGLYYSVRALSRGMAAKPGVKLQVFAVGTYPSEVMEVWEPLVPRTFPTKGPSAYGFAPRMLQAVIDFQPDIIHLHGIWMYPSLVALRAASKLDCALVLSPRGMMDVWALKNSAWKKKLMYWFQEKRLLESVSVFHALNQSEANSIRAMGYRQPICIIPNGTDLPVGAHLSECDEGRQNKNLVFIGRIHPKKGIPNLILAWGQMQKACPRLAEGWQLIIAGWDDGNHLQGYQELAQAQHCAESIEWRGAVYGEAKAKLLQEATAFVLPSFSEGLPMAVVEAWSYHLPVLMTRECNLPEGFSEGAAIEMEASENGTYDGLKKLMELPPEQLTAMGESAHQLVCKHFTWDQLVSRLETVYEWMLGKPDKPPCVMLSQKR